MGRNTSNSNASTGADRIISCVLPTGEPIERGDVVLLGADNLAYVAAMPDALPLEQLLRPTGGGPAVENFPIASSTLTSASVNGAGEERVDFIRLKNGNAVAVWLEASTAKFCILNQDSEIVRSGSVQGAALGASADTHAIGLANGGFAIAVITAAGKAAVTLYDAAGGVTTAQFVSDAGATATLVYIAQLVNGNIVTVTRANGLQIRYAVHTSAGVEVKATTAIATPANASSQDRQIAVAALTGGGFVIAYMLVNAASAASFYALRFDTQGVAQSAPVEIKTYAVDASAFVFAAGLAGGGYAVACSANGMGLFLGIYDAAGYAQGALLNLGRLANEVYGCQVALVAAPNGDAVIGYAGAAGVTVGRYAAAGNLVVSKVIDPAAYSNGSANFTVNADGSINVIGSITSASCYVYLLDPTLNQLLYYTVPMAFNNMPRLWVSTAVSAKTPLACYRVIIQQSGKIAAFTNVVKRQSFSLVGVANFPAAANANVSVQLTGVAALRRPFKQPWAVNAQGGNPMGQRMFAIGYTATLGGLISSTPTPIN